MEKRDQTLGKSGNVLDPEIRDKESRMMMKVTCCTKSVISYKQDMKSKQIWEKELLGKL